jgi:hypothetical protein
MEFPDAGRSTAGGVTRGIEMRDQKKKDGTEQKCANKSYLP